MDTIPVYLKNMSDLLSEERDNFDQFAKNLWPINNLCPFWSGFMQFYDKTHVNYPGKSSISLLPMIDMSPTDPSCVPSTMNYVCDLSGKFNVTSVLTFDQPLSIKATHIINLQDSDSYLKNNYRPRPSTSFSRIQQLS
jgi:hypothetical protein